MRKRIACIVLLLAAMICFTAAPSQAQKTSKPVRKSDKITIEFVSFPDVYKKLEVYPWETLAADDFRAAYNQMIGPKEQDEWIRLLTGTGNKNKMLYVSKTHLLYIAVCKPHFCDTHQMIVLYNPREKRCFAIKAADGKFEYLGKTDEDNRGLLRILLVDEYKDVYKGQ
jgi:hypothetical protein